MAIELIGDFAVLCRRLQPHHAHVVHMRDDRGDFAPLPIRRLGAPGLCRKIVDHVMVNAVADLERIHESIRGYERISRGRLRHKLPHKFAPTAYQDSATLLPLGLAFTKLFATWGASFVS